MIGPVTDNLIDPRIVTISHSVLKQTSLAFCVAKRAIVIVIADHCACVFLSQAYKSRINFFTFFFTVNQNLETKLVVYELGSKRGSKVASSHQIEALTLSNHHENGRAAVGSNC